MERPPAATIPEGPGSYQFLDADGRIIYVGKAKSLRSRVGSYFQSPAQLTPRTAQLMAAAASLEWITVATEVDALLLEYSLIQRHQPRFNVRYRDDKSYPFLCVTLVDEWPRAMVVRGRKRKGNRYFGPYGHAYAIRETLDLLAAHLPDPHLLGQQVRRSSATRPALPAVPHRALRRALRGGDRRGNGTANWSANCWTS